VVTAQTDGISLFVSVNLVGWQTARRYGVPAAMVAEATARRLAGDWPAAVAAARFEARVQLESIVDEFGYEVGARVEDDLHHLAPDLARWHLLQRGTADSGPLEPDLTVVLAQYGPRVPREGRVGAPCLWLRTGAHLERPQRPVLGFGWIDTDSRKVEAWSDLRHQWDARRTDELRHEIAGGDRIPFYHRDGLPLTDAELVAALVAGDPVAHTEQVMVLQDGGDLEAAWAASGVPATFPPDMYGRPGWQLRRWSSGEVVARVPALAAHARRYFAEADPSYRQADGSVRLTLQPPAWVYRPACVALTVTESTMEAQIVPDATAPFAPRGWWQRPSELELLRLGRIMADALHPLVRRAYFPDERHPGEYRPQTRPPSVGGVAVRCRGAWHHVGWRHGRVEPFDHTAEEAQRERVMRSLGGEVPRCFTVTDSWRGDVETRLPRHLRELRQHALMAISHGDVHELRRLLDLGVDPAGIRDRWGRRPLHLLAHLDAPDLVPVLVAAGLNVNERDRKDRTPLGWVLFDGGSAALVRALLDAGADPTAVDFNQDTMLHLLRTVDAGAILPTLLAAGGNLEAVDNYGRTPIMTLILTDAPAEAIRALVDAGADVSRLDEYSEESVLDMVDRAGRDDLDFVRAAYESLPSTLPPEESP
jgi:ankyrin repeat protein